MDGLVIGLDLCDTYSQVCCFDKEQSWTIPTVICRMKDAEEWSVGEEAYGHILMGDGVSVDKLLTLAGKDGTSTIGGIKYEGCYILQMFLQKVIAIPVKEFQNNFISQLMITLPDADVKLMDCLFQCAENLGISRKNVHIISHTESFCYYVLSQKKEIWSNQVGMFDLSDNSLRYYELKVQRGLKQVMIVAEHEKLEEGFNLDILGTSAGAKLADKILCACGERLILKKLYSSVFLTGRGFDNREWAPGFMKMVCSKRRVYMEPNIFSRGAAFKGADYLQEKTSYPYAFICEGRLDTTVSMKVLHKERENQLIIAAAGDSWYESQNSVDLITDKTRDVELIITPLDTKKKKLVRIPLESFPDRPNRTTRVQMNVSFLDEKTMVVELKDKGFGELFPASGAVVRQEVMLWA